MMPIPTSMDVRRVGVIETATNTRVATIRVGGDSGPFGVAITPDGAFAYVTSGRFTSLVSVIETATNMVVAEVETGFDKRPFGIAITTDGAFVYVALDQSRQVAVIESASKQ